jgi:hypothetical protein
MLETGKLRMLLRYTRHELAEPIPDIVDLILTVYDYFYVLIMWTNTRPFGALLCRWYLLVLFGSFYSSESLQSRALVIVPDGTI